jgi:hypothetical protein
MAAWLVWAAAFAAAEDQQCRDGVCAAADVALLQTDVFMQRSMDAEGGHYLSDLYHANGGDGTYFGANGDSRGACEDYRANGKTVPTGAIRVAMNAKQWSHGMSCGVCLEVTGMGFTKALAVVTDLCPECKKGDLDFALDGDGRHHVSWEAVPCTHASAFQYIMQGSNQWYVKLAVRGARVPVVKLEAKSGGAWHKGKKVEGGFFELQASGGQWNFPLQVRLTAFTGDVAMDTVPSPTCWQCDWYGSGSSQFGAKADDESQEASDESKEASDPVVDGGESQGVPGMTLLWPGTGKRCAGAPDEIRGVSWGNLGTIGMTPDACAAKCKETASCNFVAFKTGKCTQFPSCDSANKANTGFTTWKKEPAAEREIADAGGGGEQWSNGAGIYHGGAGEAAAALLLMAATI